MSAFSVLILLSLLNFSGLLDELEQLLKGIAMMKELTLRTKDYLVSFGECMSTRIFAAYLSKIGATARQVHQLYIFIVTKKADYTYGERLGIYISACVVFLFNDLM